MSDIQCKNVRMHKGQDNWQVRKLRKDEALPFDLLLMADEAIQAIEQYIDDSEVYCLFEGGVIIAEYVLKPETKDCIEIKNIAVVEKYRRQGIGKYLLHDACNRAIELGFGSIIIGTGDCSFGQLRLYQHEGFEVFDIRRDFFRNNYPEPVFENGLQLKHMIVLKKKLGTMNSGDLKQIISS